MKYQLKAGNEESVLDREVEAIRWNGSIRAANSFIGRQFVDWTFQLAGSDIVIQRAHCDGFSSQKATFGDYIVKDLDNGQIIVEEAKYFAVKYEPADGEEEDDRTFEELRKENEAIAADYQDLGQEMHKALIELEDLVEQRATALLAILGQAVSAGMDGPHGDGRKLSFCRDIAENALKAVKHECKYCKGDGHYSYCQDHQEFPCPRCNGTGVPIVPVDCINCNGTGVVPYRGQLGNCDQCNGTGVKETTC